jgi:hypothetical protein
MWSYIFTVYVSIWESDGSIKRIRPEESIVEGYIAEEIIEFYTSYLEGVEPIGLPKSRHESRLQGVGTIGYKLITVGLELRQKIYLKVLQHLVVVFLTWMSI